MGLPHLSTIATEYRNSLTDGIVIAKDPTIINPISSQIKGSSSLVPEAIA